uniref:Uncharacterized protein n=1 Tax=Oryza punctata TaxID=4537 RepID=A0A0E0KD68_ORYPU
MKMLILSRTGNQVRAEVPRRVGPLWAESGAPADGYRRIHMMNNADYIFDAEEAIPQYGGARDGTRLILFQWNGD